MMKRLLLLSSGLFLAVAARASADQAYSYTFFDVPGTATTEPSGVPGPSVTDPMGINASGQVVGTYIDANSKSHGFLLSGGKYTTIDAPGGTGTVLTGINASGEIVGYSISQPGGVVSGGFLYSNGTFTPLNTPGPSPVIPTGINNIGQIVGNAGKQDYTSGFVRSPQGVYTAINFAASSVGPNGINDSGQVVGFFADSSGGHDFLINGSAHTTFDAVNPEGIAENTTATGINNSGQIVGYYFDGHGYRSFVRGEADAFNTLFVSGSWSTVAQGINDTGEVVGSISTPTGMHGFLATPEAFSSPQPSGLILALFGVVGAGLYAWGGRKRLTLA